MAPASKRGSAAELDEHYGRGYRLDRLYRLMDSLHKRLDRLKQIVLEMLRRWPTEEAHRRVFEYVVPQLDPAEM